MSIMAVPEGWSLTEEIPRRMPVLDRWLERFGQDRPLAGVTVLNIQHQLGNHVPQTQALLHLGVAPQDVLWIDIPYTSTPAVREALFAFGIPPENFVVSDFHLLGKYAPYQRTRVQRVLRELLTDPPERLLVLDDGSYMLEALATTRGRPPFLSIVEQTTRGLIKIEDSAVLERCAREIRIVNVARSKPKTTLEPPFIGLAVTDALRRRFGTTLDPSGTERCLVLGYGAVGRQVAAFLQGFRPNAVFVHDPVKERMKEAVNDGFRTWGREPDIRFKLVIGCSGRASFGVGDYVFLEDGAFLASATSGTVELSREDFIELADASPDDDIFIERDGLDESLVHSDLRFHFVDRGATFVNGGFPINFDGRVNCIPAHYIQPTPTMMCAAAVQAMSSATPGLIDLDPDFCRWVDDDFRAELGEEASLLPGLTACSWQPGGSLGF
jgi:S-adenosylhomocysteine hydrolase